MARRGRLSVLPSWAFALAALAVLTGLLAPRVTWAATKLYLRDGTYQMVKSYEVRGDRVRYYSLERSDWEEVPLALVDLDTTRRTLEDEKSAEAKEVERARDLDKERFEIPENTGFEIAPGFRLPKDEGVFAFDGLRIIRLLQSPGELVTDKRRAALVFALPAPLVKNRSLVVLPGAKAALRLASLQPTFYVQAADGWGARAELVPVKTHSDQRIVARVEVSRGGPAKPAEPRTTLPVERQQLAPGLFKLTPTQPLEVGEYALAEPMEQKLNLDVWDFGVDGAPQGPLAAPAADRPPVFSEHAPGGQGPHQPTVRAPLPNSGLPSDSPPPPMPVQPPAQPKG
ncbi:MAG TPA: hypothetical protein VKU44_08420 [Terriglobia bacterium]|nr:hypothetical protein [Terriglobia bacterium]